MLSTAGTLVQLSGFALILRGIRRIADIFEEQPLHRRVWNWIRDLKEVWNPSPVVGQGSTAIGSAMALDAEASVSYRDAETLEERISVLEIKVENLKKGHDALRKMAKKRLNSLESKIDELEEEHKSGREEILDNLEEIAAGGLDWEFVAVVWLALGLILRSLSPWV